MIKEKIFVPVLKTKSQSEPLAIKECLHFFSNSIIPYLEIKKINNKGHIKCCKYLENILHFEQLIRNGENSFSQSIDYCLDNNNKFTIPSIVILDNDNYEECNNNISKFINSNHNNKKSCAIRINVPSNNEKLLKLILSLLNSDDYIIADINENDYNAAQLFLKRIHDITNKPKIIVLSNERPSNISNSMLEECGYNDGFNTSVISSINKNCFFEDGFATYCSAKNDTYEGEHPVKKMYATFLIYDYIKNSFFSFRTSTTDIMPKNFYKLKKIMKTENNMKMINYFFENTNISKTLLLDYLDSEKPGNASKLITISIIHHIESVYQLMN